MTPALTPYSRAQQDPAWQEARADYLRESDNPDEDFHRRIRAAYRMWEIETAEARKGCTDG